MLLCSYYALTTVWCCLSHLQLPFSPLNCSNCCLLLSVTTTTVAVSFVMMLPLPCQELIKGTTRGCTGEFSRAKTDKYFGSTYARKVEAKKTSRSTIRATPKIGDFHFQRWWPIFTCDNYFAMSPSHPPGFSNVVARGFCMRVPLRG